MEFSRKFVIRAKSRTIFLPFHGHLLSKSSPMAWGYLKIVPNIGLSMKLFCFIGHLINRSTVTTFQWASKKAMHRRSRSRRMTRNVWWLFLMIWRAWYRDGAKSIYKLRLNLEIFFLTNYLFILNCFYWQTFGKVRLEYERGAGIVCWNGHKLPNSGSCVRLQ